MFKLKIPKDLVDVYYDGISLDVGNKLMIKYTSGDGKTIESEDILTLKTITHYNEDLFCVTFNEISGSFVYSINQLVRFKISNLK
ncbi:hypothetical protein ACSW8S_15315 (plasmid) [Clostridium perfringens]